MMKKEKTILLTGAAGFIGSYLLGYLNGKGYENIIIVDDFSREDKKNNYETKKIIDKIEREILFDWLKNNDPTIDFVFHLGARTDTTEFDYSIHEKLNVEYSKNIWNYCTDKNIPLVYASSAATYGAGELGYKDDHNIVEKLHPLNPYGISKNEFDKWALRQTNCRPELVEGQESGFDKLSLTTPPFWAGLKFFNVYGPNEYHKGRMASMIFHGFNQVQSTGKIKLFKSHKPEYKDGEQLRDFIYVEDVANVCYWMMISMDNRQWAMGNNGIYNLGTGKARTFNDLANATFTAMGKEAVIEYIDMPEDIRDKYQYFTEADMNKLRKAGFTKEFYTLENGVSDYVMNFLIGKKYY
ncbi:MAG TPA: ADP-glyceromanno-heptose 6-epimerase [Chitinophagaceae bacterium]|nr:ADP-glyceromanno-heptose 6-epimerase [Chitinophagaceae bacterium]